MIETGKLVGCLSAVGVVVAASAVIAGAPALVVTAGSSPAPRVGPVASQDFQCPQVILDRIGRDGFAAIDDVHKAMLINLVEGAHEDLIAPCFLPGTNENTIAAFEAVFERLNPDRYNQTSRWSNNVASGSAGIYGDPCTLTYSYVPDGTFVPSGVGEPAANSNLFAFLNGIYGAPATWQALYDSVFDRWEELSGINYVYEPNDDGAAMFGASGILGVRGDLRFSGKTIDGNSNILAYNFFPNTGDMVIDTADNFFNNTTQSSRRLRNVLSHEHGHGMGQLHVCPVQQTKLMEPFVSTAYDGPRHDDIRNAHRFYGDINEPDNSPGAATNLGALPTPSFTNLGPVPSPTVSNGSLISIDANGEQDYFRFTVSGASEATITVTPIGLNYIDDTQAGNGSCNSTTTTDSLAQADLAVELLDIDGATPLATAASQPIGTSETLSNILMPVAGEYYIRVYETGSVFETQLYHLTVSIGEPTTGACCIAGSCADLIEDDCVTAAGAYQGDGTDCGSVSCIPVGACCFSCILPVVAPCPVANSGGPSCVELEEDACLALNGLYAGDDTLCTDDPAPCQCPADLNGDGATNAADFTILAGQFGQGTPDCRSRAQGDLNCDGVVNAADFTILAGNFGCSPL